MRLRFIFRRVSIIEKSYDIAHYNTPRMGKAQQVGEYTASSLRSEGFIHCSTVKQAADTANIFFRDKID